MCCTKLKQKNASWIFYIMLEMQTHPNMSDEQLLGTGRNIETMISTQREMYNYCGCALLPFTLLLKQEDRT